MLKHPSDASPFKAKWDFVRHFDFLHLWNHWIPVFSLLLWTIKTPSFMTSLLLDVIFLVKWLFLSLYLPSAQFWFYFNFLRESVAEATDDIVFPLWIPPPPAAFLRNGNLKYKSLQNLILLCNIQQTQNVNFSIWVFASVFARGQYLSSERWFLPLTCGPQRTSPSSLHIAKMTRLALIFFSISWTFPHLPSSVCKAEILSPFHYSPCFTHYLSKHSDNLSFLRWIISSKAFSI
jgi:hypothetical protein